MPQAPIPNILSLLTFLPLIGAIILMSMKRPQDLPEHHGDHDDHDAHGAQEGPAIPYKDAARSQVNFVATAVALINFLVSIVMFMAFQSDYVNVATRNMHFMEVADWIKVGSLSIQYRMGVDGVSVLLILLTTFLSLLCVVFSWNTRQRLKEFMVFLLLLETGMIGVFCALDLVLFYVFWEAMLIPMYFLIGIFGHENRIYAAVKFFIYTFAGSVLMLVAIIWIYQTTNSFDVLALSDPTSGAGRRLMNYGLANPQPMLWLFGAFSLAFMIKVPMFPFHTWLPDAHVEAPTAGSVILAGVLLKMGTYGFIRFCLPMFPAQAQQMAWLFITLAIIGIVYGSIVAAVQPDAKKLVAYSSVAHLGFVILGIFSFTEVGMMGALIQNINHGISTPMLFFLVGMLYERRHTRLISEFGGLKRIMPMFATMLLISVLASVAVPFFNGFVGEFPILVGSWISSKTQEIGGYWPTTFAATGMILSAVYMLWWFQRLMLGPVTKPVNRRLPDMSRIEWAVMVPLVVMVFWIGLFSHFWTKRMDTAVMVLLPVQDEQVVSDLPIFQVQQTRRLEDAKKRGITPSRPGVGGQRRAEPLTVPGGAESSTEPPPSSSVPPTADPGGEPVGGGVSTGQPSATPGSGAGPDSPVTSPPANTQTEGNP